MEITSFCVVYRHGPTPQYQMVFSEGDWCFAYSGLPADTFFRTPQNQRKAGIIRVFVSGGMRLINPRVRILRGIDASNSGKEISIPFQLITVGERLAWHFEPIPPGMYTLIAEADNAESNDAGVKVRKGEAYRFWIGLKPKRDP